MDPATFQVFLDYIYEGQLLKVCKHSDSSLKLYVFCEKYEIPIWRKQWEHCSSCVEKIGLLRRQLWIFLFMPTSFPLSPPRSCVLVHSPFYRSKFSEMGWRILKLFCCCNSCIYLFVSCRRTDELDEWWMNHELINRELF